MLRFCCQPRSQPLDPDGSRLLTLKAASVMNAVAAIPETVEPMRMVVRNRVMSCWSVLNGPFTSSSRAASSRTCVRAPHSHNHRPYREARVQRLFNNQPCKGGKGLCAEGFSRRDSDEIALRWREEGENWYQSCYIPHHRKRPRPGLTSVGKLSKVVRPPTERASQRWAPQSGRTLTLIQEACNDERGSSVNESWTSAVHPRKIGARCSKGAVLRCGHESWSS